MLLSRFSLLFLLFLGFTGAIIAQNSHHHYQRIQVSSAANELLRTAGFDLDHGSDATTSFVYADPDLLSKLSNAGFEFTFTPDMNERVNMIDVAAWNAQKSGNCEVPTDAYPTYELYEQLMTAFATDYPEISRLHVIGSLPSGRRILALEITDFPDEEEEEPKMLYTSSMHGDELGGYHITLRLINYLLCSYGTDTDLTNLINTSEIWINPLANPDGAYRDGNSTVNGARRANGNGVDLNRNFPDPDNGDHPDGNSYQPETEIFMDFAEEYTFDISLNFHGGAEVFNYPWDTYSQRHPDDEWWIHVAREFADTCQHRANYDGFFSDLDNGITNGYDWYPVAGGRQDYVTYYQRGREATLEISGIKLLPPGLFNDVWEQTRDPLINFLHQGTYGLRGTVTDSITGEPLLASITIPGHDNLNSDVFSKLPTGRYHRYLKAGVYSVVYAADGYIPKVITYNVEDQQPNFLHVQLVSETFTSVNDNLLGEDIRVHFGEGLLNLFNLPLDRQNTWQLQLLTIDGRQLLTESLMDQQVDYSFSVGSLPSGIYLARILGNGRQQAIKFEVVRKKKR